MNAEPLTNAALAQRLQRLRSALDLTQRSFAAAMRIGASRLASYESGRVPLRWEFVRAIAARLYVNPGCLVKDKYFIFQPFDEHLLTAPIPPRAKFLSVFASDVEPFLLHVAKSAPVKEGTLSPALSALAGELIRLGAMPIAERVRIVRAPWFLPRAFALRAMLSAWLEDAEFETVEDVQEAVVDRSNVQILGHLNEKDWENDLTNYPLAGNNEPMPKRDLETLLNRVRDLTKVRGSRKLFAEKVGTTPNRLSDWLRGDREPDARQTLLMLDLVEKGWRPPTQ